MERPDTLRNQQVRCSSHPTSSRHCTLFECGAFLYSNRITLKGRSVTGRSGLSHDLLRIVIILAAGIDFQLHAEVPRAIAAKQRSRLVVIIVDGLFPTYAGVAVIADRSILVAILIVGIVLMDDPAAVFAAGVVPVVAGLAEGGVVVSGIVVPVDALAAVGADHGLLIGTGFTELIIVHQDALTQRMGVPTVAAGKGVFFHNIDPPDFWFRPWYTQGHSRG